MKNIFLLLSLSIFLIVSCKKDDNNPIDTGTVLLEQTVTSEGATLSSGIFTVEIPKNAFVEATTITLSKISDSPFGTDQKSEVYFVNNLPAEINVPIILSLSGFSSDDDITTFIAEKTYIKSLNEVTFSYRYTPHVFIDGKLQINLNMGSLTSNKSISVQPGADSHTSMGATAAAGRHQPLSSGGHFRINYPVAYMEQAEKLLPYLEEAYTKYEGSPFSLSYAKRTVWPVEVTIRGLKTGVYGYCAASTSGDNYNFLEFNLDKLSEEAAMHITAGHEFMHFVQLLYDPRWSITKAYSEPEQLWLDEAASVWAEGLFTSAKDYFSSVRKDNEMVPFAALRKGKEAKAQDYGYGMAALIKYLVARETGGIILKINEQISKGEKPAEAIRLATGKSYWEWYGYYIDQYILGNLYKDVGIGSLVTIKSDVFDIKKATDLNKEFVSDYGQLQSKIYLTTLNADVLSDNSSLNFKIKSPDNEMINVYKYKNQTIENIGQNVSNVSVPGIKKIVQDGYKIMTVVTNQKYDYTSDAKQNITLVTSLSQTSIYKSFSFSLVIMCNWKGTSSDGSIQTGTNKFQPAVYHVPCITNGKTITSSWDGTYGNNHPIKGSATITIESDNTLTYTITNEETGPYEVESFTATGAGLPLYSDLGNIHDFGGAPSYKYVQTFRFKRVNQGAEYVTEVTDFLKNSLYDYMAMGFTLFKD